MFAIKGGIGIDGIVKTLIIAIGRDDNFFSPMADSIAFAAEDYFLFRYMKNIFNYTPQIVAAPDMIIETFGSILNNFPL